MCTHETTDHLSCFAQLGAPPPPSFYDNREILAEGRRVADQAAADHEGEPEEKVRKAMARALHLHWISIPW